jgi:diazepam-binding inhibitor (GABA receptor modulating acyl-CoA-binding protein)
MENEKDLFLEAVANAVKLNGSPSNDEKGTLYGLYKQATVGDITTAQPYFYEIIARGKWDAWNSHKSKTSDQAKKEYIDFVGTLIAKYGLMDAVVSV